MPVPKELLRSTGGKVVLLVIDGLGGLPHPDRGQSELEAARIPVLDDLAGRSSVGRVRLLAPGLTPGSGPGHLSLFGYDPTTVDLGRGVLEALGCDYPLAAGEVAARGNFCTLDGEGIVRDRRAGRPADEICRALCAELSGEITLAGADFQLLPGKQHRFTLILKGAGLGHHLNDNDPQIVGKAPLAIQGADAASQVTAGVVNDFLTKSREVLRSKEATTGMLLRGFSCLPEIEPFEVRHGLRPAAIAVYPMYRGVARLVGMDILPAGTDLSTQIARAAATWDEHDFFFLHTKDADTAGHSGDFDEKVAALEEVDRHIPQLEALGAEVILITGDHSTPTLHREHSWHPVPVILHSSRSIPVADTTFSERGVLRGDLGVIQGWDLMPLALAHGHWLDKYGA